MTASDAPSIEILPVDSWADHVAGLLAHRMATQPDLVLCLPTGSTPLPVYAALPGVLARRGVDASEATVVLLDEYLVLPPGHRARCDETLRSALLSGLERAGAGRPGFVAFDIDGVPPEEACARMDAAIGAAGGLDLVVLGLGSNGHVGMNEPGAAVDSPTRVVELAPPTRAAAVGYGADPPPTHGVTLGMATILSAREVWLLATGARKTAILAQALDGPATVDVPASLIPGHHGLRVIADEAAAAATRSAMRDSGHPRRVARR